MRPTPWFSWRVAGFLAVCLVLAVCAYRCPPPKLSASPPTGGY